MAIHRNTLSKTADAFLTDVITGLSSIPKRLPSKYFYNERGDEIFAEIMLSPDYYLSLCEMEIFRDQSKAIADIIDTSKPFDLIELGPGNGSKTKFLIEELLNRKADFVYYPVDISDNIIRNIKDELDEFFFLKIHGINEEYISGLKKVNTISNQPKIVLWLGSSVGNMSDCESIGLLKQINSVLNTGDKLITGFDLKKDPRLILNAYDDAEGLTKEFNLNLLLRINEELDADFNLSDFYHFPSYDPVTGECKSFLISRKEQVAHICGERIYFEKNEPIFTEVSRKFSKEEIALLAELTCFDVIADFYDSKNYFVDSVWKKI